MIRLENLSKTYLLHGKRKVVADNINLTIPDRTGFAIMGRNGAGKSTLLRLIAGTMKPDSGRVISTGTISWPVGFAGSFHGDLTGVQNTRFIARVYGVDTTELCRFVEDFAGLGQHYNLPVRSYSSGMRSRLAFGISMGIQFDTYLVDEVMAAGDASFRARSDALFHERVKDSAVVMVTHNFNEIRRLCSQAAVLENGRLDLFDDVEEAIRYHHALMNVTG
ncbi:ABC transporter ATP-binding protein [Oceanicola sp. 22II-s10i]|uniref:ABC transporter ATP-binding protein n=1 Tax=Oceanicola sp. 22II-s10i TaxID=1317116 RepID=UPI000B520E3D|nr:ABC transporter ATP-binding protein [Oceanicola sp. 22II-s10i]OWU81674.1 ABC transporter ATP-binding protein [Oceanicola sp. 22II-s10i]